MQPGFGGQQIGGWQQPQGYQFRPTPGINKDHIKHMIPQLFNKYDYDRSGRLHMNEAAMAIQEIYAGYGQMPSQNDVMYAFQYFDRDRSGMLDRKEFKKMAKYLAGIPSKKGHW